MSDHYGHNRNTKKQQGWNVKEPSIKADTAPKQRVDLNPADFDNLVEQKGVNILVYRSMYCPNVKSVDGAEHDIDCQICKGKNYIDLDPIKTKAYISTQELERMEGNGVYHDGNTVLMTFKVGIEVQYFTLIELCDFLDIYYQRVIRNPDSDVDVLRFKACRINTVIDRNGVRYYQEQDFKINPDGNIQWLTRRPDDWTVYSLHYEKHSSFRAVKAMHANRYTQYKPSGQPDVEFIKLPQQWMATKEFLLLRKSIQNGEVMQTGPYDNHSDTTGQNDNQPED
jgi:hypothetical protein